MKETIKETAEKVNKQFDTEICKGNCEKCDYKHIKERGTCKAVFIYNQGRLNAFASLD